MLKMPYMRSQVGVKKSGHCHINQLPHIRPKRLRAVILISGVLIAISGFIALLTIQRTPTLMIAGSTTLLPVLNQLVGKYKLAEHVNSEIAVQGGGSSLGISYLNQSLTDASSESRYPKFSEYSSTQNCWARRRLSTYLIGGDLIVFIANLKGILPQKDSRESTFFKQLDIRTLNDIYSGQITN